MTTLPVMKVVLFLIASLFSCALFAAGKDTRPNILFIMVDDLAPVGSGFTGPVDTPALDELAARGYLFTNNFSNVPVCGASRASMLGGIAPNAERFLTYNSRLDIDAPGAMSLPAFFKANGWHTLANGKIFDVIDDSAQGWSEPVWNPDNQWYSNQDVDERGEHLQKAYIAPIDGARAPTYEKLAVEDDAYPDGQIALKSAADLKRLSESAKPFFLAVGFRKPHLPFNAPARYWTDEPAEIALPVTWHRLTPLVTSSMYFQHWNLAGLPRPDHLDGHSLVPLLRNPSMPDRTEKPVSVSMWANGVSVRDTQYRYTRWHNKQNETISRMLFDLHADPDELENSVASRPTPIQSRQTCLTFSRGGKNPTTISTQKLAEIAV